MSIASTFLSLTVGVAFPLALIAAIFHGAKLRPRNGGLGFFNFVAFALTIGALVNAIIGLALSEEAYSYYNTYSKRLVYEPEYIHPCSWVAMGLCIGAMVMGLIVMLSTFGCIKRRKRRRQLANANKAQEQTTKDYFQRLSDQRNQTNGQDVRRNAYDSALQTESVKQTHNTDYIDEIKRLKELLDCDAITQEEYDAKKKEILSR